MVCTGLHCSAEGGTDEYGKARDCGGDDIADQGKLAALRVVRKKVHFLTNFKLPTLASVP